jgi:DNA-binding SARP family transcriptional activator
MAHLALALLGPLHITLDARPVAGFDYDKVRALLAYLAVEADRAHRRAALAGLLWPDQSEQAAHTSLRQALATLRRAIGDHAVPITRISVMMSKGKRCITSLDASPIRAWTGSLCCHISASLEWRGGV